MKNYIPNLEEATVENTDYRRVLCTVKDMQLVVMSLQPGETIPQETHGTVGQFIRVEAGEGKAILSGEEFALHDGASIIIPQGTAHEIINSGKETLKLYTIYTPPEHPDGTVHETPKDALVAQHHHEI